MKLINSSNRWGLISILFHWLSALVILFLFALGLYMTSLNYYDPWYHQAPYLHKSVGVLLLMLTVLRIAWLFLAGIPTPLVNQSRLQTVIATGVHRLMYLLIFLILSSGYLISTANGDSVEIFGWFQIPSLISGGEKQAEIAGELHLIFAATLVVLAAVHALAAGKHHFVDKDNTLNRMLGIQRRRKT